MAEGARAAEHTETTARAVSRQEIEVVADDAPETVLVGMDGGSVRSRENVRGQASHIVDAEALQAAGDVVGSGMVEKAVDLVINRRITGRQGMCWSRATANAIVTNRTRILNATWSTPLLVYPTLIMAQPPG